jgi:hypothetical protein
MSTEYGIFNEEGCTARGFWSVEEAEAYFAECEDYEVDERDDYDIEPVCEHDGEVDDCEICLGEDDD